MDAVTSVSTYQSLTILGEVGVSGQDSRQATVLIAQWRAGNSTALEALIPLLYAELHRLAHHYLRGEHPGHTLQSTALVNEAYLRLVGQVPGQIDNRAHFLGVAAHVMRQILVDHARVERAAKRDGGYRIELDESMQPLQCAIDVNMLALDEALNGLAQLDPDQCRIVEMRFFAGLSIEETAAAMGISTATVKREWAIARAWLSRELSEH
jgi:RNA polymerase sigma factor (TIGR02999 family)